MYKKIYMKLANEIKHYFVDAGFDPIKYDEIVQNIRMTFPSGRKEKFEVMLEDLEGEKFNSVEELEDAYAFNIVKVMLKDDRLVGIKPVIVFPETSMGASKVFFFIHEFIHYLTYKYKETEKFIVFGSGLDVCRIDKEKMSLTDDEKYLIFNEAITNVITYHICRDSHYTLETAPINNCIYNRCSNYLEKILKQKGTVNDLLNALLKDDKKAIINLFTNEQRKEKRLLKNLDLLYKNNTDSVLEEELRQLLYS